MLLLAIIKFEISAFKAPISNQITAGKTAEQTTKISGTLCRGKGGTLCREKSGLHYRGISGTLCAESPARPSNLKRK